MIPTETGWYFAILDPDKYSRYIDKSWECVYVEFDEHSDPLEIMGCEYRLTLDYVKEWGGKIDMPKERL